MPELMTGYQEVPRLATHFLAFNVRQGSFVDPGLRRDFARAFDIDAVVRETAGRLVLRASGLIPPGLLGHEASDPQKPLAYESPEVFRGSTPFGSWFIRYSTLTNPFGTGSVGRGPTPESALSSSRCRRYPRR